MSDRSPTNNMEQQNPEENQEFGYLDMAISKEQQKAENIQEMRKKEEGFGNQRCTKCGDNCKCQDCKCTEDDTLKNGGL
ncbi:unnamed protein product [Caenorhabditis brenneri]